ncbi:MAG: hypothetical protein GXY83_28860 [Rhodopirellula sp.]|nr:hypothetical protein [Rhodopirellula sp.]
MNTKERIIRSKLARLDPSNNAALIARLNAELAQRPKAEPPGEQPPVKSNVAPEPKHSSPLTEADVENFRSLNTDVLIRSAAFGDIWLVPERTGAGRFELLPAEVLALEQAHEMFDARIVEVTKNVPA